MILLTVTDLGLPLKYGFGLWTKALPVPAGDWAAAEDTLVRAAQDWMTDPDNTSPTGYRLVRSDMAKRLSLSLMR